MPLDEPPNLISMLIAVERAAVGELYRELQAAGFDGLSPASAPIFQLVRPGGSRPAEIAALAGASPAAVEEQVAAMAAAGYVARLDDGTVELSARGRAAADLGLRTIARLEERWRRRLGPEAFDAFAGAVAQLNLDPLGRRSG